MEKHNVSYTVKNKLCAGCGICEDVCPKHCITIKLKNGELKPNIDESSCLGEKCGRCLKVCPGIGIEFNKIAQNFFKESTIKEDKYIGRHVALHTGYSLDYDIRYHSASGGVVSQFLIFLLEKKIIDGAVVTGFSDDHITPMSYIARTKDDITRSRSSKYCPVALNKIGNEILKLEGKYVIVGLPCHIQGFRKRLAIDKKMSDKVIGLFSIYCSSSRNFFARDYLLSHYRINKEDISYFSFRDNGCLGNLTVEIKKRDQEKSRLVGTHSTDYTGLKIPYSQYYGPMLRSFFKPHRCLMCIDHYGELADVSFGDIHIKPFSDDHIGISSWITRTEYWEQLFRQAVTEGCIKMDDVDADTLNQSQKAMLYPKKRRARAVMNMDRFLGRANPKYDKRLDKPGIKDYFTEILCGIQQYIGKRKELWFLIELINRK